MGIKLILLQCVCCLRRGVYLELGGFPHPVIFNEDLIFAAGAIQNGWKIIYKADARVIHSHEYTYRELIRRNFDQGVSQACHPEIFEKVKSEKEGIQPDLHTCEKAFKRKKIFADYTAVCGKRVQISGLPDGKTITDNYRKVSSMKLTMNHNYWRGRNDEDA